MMRKPFFSESPPVWFEHLRAVCDYMQKIYAPLWQHYDRNPPDSYMQQCISIMREDPNLISLHESYEEVIRCARKYMLINLNRPWEDIQERYDDWSEAALLKLKYTIEEYQRRNYPSQLFFTSNQ
jgi:hypothetical protein